VAEQIKQDKVETDADKRRKAYSNALTLLKNAHVDEFESLREAECERLGVAYSRRLTAKERAAIQVQALLAEYPSLLDTIVK
jgi:hypothetical protein